MSHRSLRVSNSESNDSSPVPERIESEQRRRKAPVGPPSQPSSDDIQVTRVISRNLKWRGGVYRKMLGGKHAQSTNLHKNTLKCSKNKGGLYSP